MVKAVRLIQEGNATDTEIADLVGVAVKSIQRARRAVRLITRDRQAQVPAEWKVPAAVVAVIRQEVRP